MEVIKRYPNRKLYNTSSKQYVTLNELAEIIRNGQEVQILDHATGEDLTAVTLTQIIFEQEKKQGGYLPRSVLTGLVQSGGQTLSNLRRALASPLDLFHHVDLEISRRIDVLVQNGEITAEDADEFKAMLILDFQQPTELSNLSEAQLERILTDKGVPTHEDLQKLNQNLESLVAKLDRLGSDSVQEKVD